MVTTSSIRMVTTACGFVCSLRREFVVKHGLSISRALSTSQEEPSLAQWHAAIAKVPRVDILPVGLGNVDNRANSAAFFGDQKLSLHVGLDLRQKGYESRGVGWLTQVAGQAVSNDLLAARFATILPIQSEGLMQTIELKVHNAGTMVEAAVDAVKDDDAVAELASWLVEASLALGDKNSKGRLLELGGGVTSIRDPEHVDHEGGFIACASLGTESAKASGRSKAEAEQMAAAKVLDATPGASSWNFAPPHSASALADMENAKARLLGMGGSIQCTRDPRSSDHQPRFVAVATLGTATAEMDGRKKKEAEARAAAELLRTYMQISDP